MNPPVDLKVALHATEERLLAELKNSAGSDAETFKR